MRQFPANPPVVLSELPSPRGRAGKSVYSAYPLRATGSSATPGFPTASATDRAFLRQSPCRVPRGFCEAYNRIARSEAPQEQREPRNPGGVRGEDSQALQRSRVVCCVPYPVRHILYSAQYKLSSLFICDSGCEVSAQLNAFL